MKRKYFAKQPGIGDFKNKCSEMVKLYDARIIRVIYETIHENVYWKGASPNSIKKDVLDEIKAKLIGQKVLVLHLEFIVDEILVYFGNFLILLDSGKRRQN
jgi:hypothetical protein